MSFVELGLDELEQLACLMGAVLRAYRDECGDPAYNLMLSAAALGESATPGHQWYMVLRPRIGKLAGFELSSGVYINPSSPEADAEYLRSVVRLPAQIGD